MEEKVVLDRRSFEALAVDSRVRMLKSLKERRKTLTEISRELGMSVSGVKEHLETLEAVGLVKKIDDGHKWKYYELTRKGADIVAPKELRVWILLSISMIALVASMTALLYPPSAAPGGPQLMAAAAENAPAASQGGALALEATNDADYSATEDAAAAKDAGPEEAPLRAMVAEPTAADSTAAGGEGDAAPAEGPDLAMPMAVGAVSAMTLLACVAILVRNRKKLTSL